MWLAYLTVAHAAETTTAGCATRPDAARIEGALAQLEASWGALDEAGFRRHADELRYLLPCAAEVLPPTVAARTHRAFALDAWVRGEPERAVESLRAARALDPAWVAPPGWLPDELALRELAPVALRRAPPPRAGAVAWDGIPSDQRPDGAAVVQWVGDDGALLGSWYVQAHDPLPDYDPRYRSRRNLLGVAVTGLALGGATYAAAFASSAGLERAQDLDEVRAVQVRTNALTAGGVGLVVGGGASLALAWTVGR